MAIENIDVLKEANELDDIVNEFEKVKEMPNPPEKFYPINRAARRKAAKKNKRG